MNRSLLEMSRTELSVYRAKLAKTQNQRMRRMESSGYDFGGAYSQAESYLDAMNRKRFSESKNYKGTTEDLINEIQKLEHISDLKSATASGIKGIVEENAKDFESRYSEELSQMNYNPATLRTREFYEFINSEVYSNIRRFYGSETPILDYIQLESEDKNPLDFFNKFVEWTEKQKPGHEVTFKDYNNYKQEYLLGKVTKKKRKRK